MQTKLVLLCLPELRITTAIALHVHAKPLRLCGTLALKYALKVLCAAPRAGQLVHVTRRFMLGMGNVEFPTILGVEHRRIPSFKTLGDRIPQIGSAHYCNPCILASNIFALFSVRRTSYIFYKTPT